MCLYGSGKDGEKCVNSNFQVKPHLIKGHHLCTLERKMAFLEMYG